MAFWNKNDEQQTILGNPELSRDEKQETKTSAAASTVSSETSAQPESSQQQQEKKQEPKAPLTPEESIADRFGKVRSALGPGTVIQGKLSFDTPVRIDGKLSGEIFSTQALIVGESGEINADVQVASLIIMGSVKGKIKASNRVELIAGGSLIGEIESPVFVVEDNAIFDGKCSMGVVTTQLTSEDSKTAEAAIEETAAAKKSPEGIAAKSAAKGKKDEQSSSEARVH